MNQPVPFQKVLRRITDRSTTRIRNKEYQWQWRWDRNDFGDIILTNTIGFPYSKHQPTHK